MDTRYTVLDAPRCRLGEGPFWDKRRNRYVWVDIVGNRVYWIDQPRGTLEGYEAPDWISSVVPCSDGRYLAAAYHSLYWLEPETGRFELALEIGGLGKNVRFNDCKCDVRGRLWAGTMAIDCSPGQGCLYKIGPGFRVSKVLEGLSIANGMDWSPDGKIMYFIEFAVSR